MSAYKLIAGLGNPDAQYEKTRHNIGFRALDELVSETSKGGAAGWKERRGALMCEARVGRERCMLIKPQRYMNCSGEVLADVMRYYKIGRDELIVVHDDADLDLGTLRVKQGGGDGGHNGIGSTIAALGSPDFVRVRLGVGRPVFEEGQEIDFDLSSWVLGRFSAEEDVVVAGLVERCHSALRELCAGGLLRAQNRFN